MGPAAWTTSLHALWELTSWCIMGTVVSVSMRTQTHTQSLFMCEIKGVVNLKCNILSLFSHPLAKLL